MPRYLLDATTVFAAASGEAATLAQLARLEIGEVAIPAMVYAELLAALAAEPEKNRRLQENVALIAGNVEILPFDRKAAETFGTLLRDIEPKRRRMHDRMTAALAIAQGLTLVTLAPGDFSDLPGLSLESWG